MPRLPILLLLAVLPSSALGSDVHKCTDAEGRVSFTDRPCPAGTDAEAVRLRSDETGRAAFEAGQRQQRAACIELARPAWDLLPREAAGQLDADAAATLRDSRTQLQAQCRMRLSTSPLAYDCRERLGVLSRATARAVDPRFAAERDRLQADFDQRCGEAAIRADIDAYLRPSDDVQP
jgi:hypothetical protein